MMGKWRFTPEEARATRLRILSVLQVKPDITLVDLAKRFTCNMTTLKGLLKKTYGNSKKEYRDMWNRVEEENKNPKRPKP